jgi:hypothetical protein
MVIGFRRLPLPATSGRIQKTSSAIRFAGKRMIFPAQRKRAASAKTHTHSLDAGLLVFAGIFCAFDLAEQQLWTVR